MLLFWKLYFICLGIAIFFILLTLGLFELDDEEKIQIPYAILAAAICAVPGLGMLGTLILIVAIIAGVIEGAIVPKKFEKDEDE